MRLSTGSAVALLSIFALHAATPALAQNEFSDALTQLAQTEIAAIAGDPALIDAIKAQNAATAGYDQAKIDELDTEWRAEVSAASKPLIDDVMGNAASKYLAGVKEASGGKFTEIFAMDAKGLNVAQSDVTSDYWQGDEGKWQHTYAVGAGAIDIGDVEQDESTQTFQSQVSITVIDPADGSVIGALTVGVDVSAL